MYLYSCLFIYLSFKYIIILSIYLSIRLFFLSFYLFIYFHFFILTYWSNGLSFFLSFHLLIYISFYMSFFLFFNSPYLNIYLSINSTYVYHRSIYPILSKHLALYFFSLNVDVIELWPISTSSSRSLSCLSTSFNWLHQVQPKFSYFFFPNVFQHLLLYSSLQLLIIALYKSAYLPFFLSIFLSNYSSIHTFTYLPLYLAIYTDLYWSIFFLSTSSIYIIPQLLYIFCSTDHL